MPRRCVERDRDLLVGPDSGQGQVPGMLLDIGGLSRDTSVQTAAPRGVDAPVGGRRQQRMREGHPILVHGDEAGGRGRVELLR